MYCLADKDQPLRVRLTKSGVVHAAAYRNYGGFTQWYQGDNRSEYVPKQKRLEIACRWRRPGTLDEFLVPNTEKITCKSCMKRMGMVEGPISPKRYVVHNKDTGEYLKNTNTRCSGWSDSLSDAFFFRTEHTAEDKCKVYRYRVGNKLLTYTEWAKAGRPERKQERIHDPCLEVKAVKITLE